MTRHRGNPNWGKSADQIPPMPVSLCGWDLLLYRLNSEPSRCAQKPTGQGVCEPLPSEQIRSREGA